MAKQIGEKSCQSNFDKRSILVLSQLSNYYCNGPLNQTGQKMVKIYHCVMVTPLHCLEAFTTNNNCASSLSSVVTSSSFCANGPGTLQCRIEYSAVMSVGRGKFGLNSFHYALLLSGPKVNKNYFSSHQSLEVLLLVVSTLFWIVKCLIFLRRFYSQ